MDATPINSAPEGPARILFLYANGSHLKWCRAVKDIIASQGCRIDILRWGGVETAALASEVNKGGRMKVSNFTFFDTYHMLFIMLPGKELERLIYLIRENYYIRHKKYPMIATGYPGLVVDNHVTNFLYRSSSDLIFVNSRHDYELFSSACEELKIPSSNLFLSGLPFQPITNTGNKGSHEVKKVLFADQNLVPRQKGARQEIYDGLLKYCSDNPKKKIYFKGRSDASEKSALSFSSYLAGTRRPKNLSVVEEEISNLISEIDLLMTVSSTSAVEALEAGCRVAILTDAGIKEEFGNHIFIGSGLLKTTIQVSSGDIGQVNVKWLDRYHAFQREGRTAISSIVAERLSKQNNSRDLFVETSYFNARRNKLLLKHSA